MEYAIVGFLIFTLFMGLGFWFRCCIEERKAALPDFAPKFRTMNRLYFFHLSRIIENGDQWIQSTHTIEMTTDDPVRTRDVILKQFPGWGFVSMGSVELDADTESRR